MTLLAPIDSQRAYRFQIDREGTLRDTASQPHDVVIEDLSSSGCRFRTNVALQVGSLISLGIPGLGMQMAEVVRRDEDRYGCFFVAPLDPAKVPAVLTAGTVVEMSVSRMSIPAEVAALELSGAPQTEYSKRRKLAIVLGSSLALWSMAGGVIYAAFH